MKAVVSLLLLCLLQVTLAQEQQEVESAAGEGGSLQPAGMGGLLPLVRENREAKRRNRNGKEGGKKEQKKGKNAKKVEVGKKGPKKFKNKEKSEGRNKATKKRKNSGKGKGRNKATKKPKNNIKRKNRKETTKKKRNNQNKQKKQKQERTQKIKDGSIAKKQNGRKGKIDNKPKGKKHTGKNRNKNSKRNKNKITRQNIAETFPCAFWRFSRNASIALTQSQRAKRTRMNVKRLEKRSKTSFLPIFKALSKATNDGSRCAGAPINNTVAGTFLILKDTCNSTNIMAKCNSALITLLTPQTNKTINDCESKLKSFNSKYKLSLFRESGGVVSGVCPALLAIKPTIDALTADNCFDQDTFKDVTAQAVTVFDNCTNVIQQCNRASDTAALDLLPCLAGETTTTPGTTTVGQQSVPLTTPTTTTTTPATTTVGQQPVPITTTTISTTTAGSMMSTMAPGARNLRRHLVEKLFNKH